MRKLIFVLLVFLFACEDINSQSLMHSLLASGVPQVTDNYAAQGLTFIQNNSRFFYDFTEITGANGAAISNGNAGLNDMGPNNLDAVIVGTPVVRDLSLRYGSTVKTLQDNSTNAVSIGVNGQTIFNSSFELWFVYETQDGNPSATMNWFGGIIPSNQGVNVFLGANGTLSIAYGVSSSFFQYTTTSDLWNNNVNGLSLVRIRVDFTTDDVAIYDHGYEIVGSMLSGTIVGKDPTAFANTSNIYIGSVNNNGTTVTNPNTSSILMAGCFGLLTDDEALYVQSYMYEKTFKWQDEVSILSVEDAGVRRADFIDEITNGNGLAALSYSSIATSYTGAMHICNSTNLTGEGLIDKIQYQMNDVDGYTWTSHVFYIRSATPNGKLVINSQGHISDVAAAHEAWMSELLTEGFDVLFVAPPISSADNTEANPSITLTSTAGHNQILSTGLDRAGWNATELFFFDKTSAITYLIATYGYTEVYFTGISGGAWNGLVLGALDERIHRAISVRGSMPKSFWDSSFPYEEGDFEQGGGMFTQVNCGPRLWTLYTDLSVIDMYLMAASNGRRYKLINHRDDTCCIRGTSFSSWYAYVRNKAYSLGGIFESATDTDASRATHQYSSWDMDEMMEFLTR